MKVERFNINYEYPDEINNIINKVKQNVVVDEIHYTLYSITLFRKNGELYEENRIRPDSVVRTSSLEKCVYFYELYKKNYDFLFIVKESSKDELVSDDDIQLHIKSKKYNL